MAHLHVYKMAYLQAYEVENIQIMMWQIARWNMAIMQVYKVANVHSLTWQIGVYNLENWSYKFGKFVIFL